MLACFESSDPHLCRQLIQPLPAPSPGGLRALQSCSSGSLVVPRLWLFLLLRLGGDIDAQILIWPLARANALPGLYLHYVVHWQSTRVPKNWSYQYTPEYDFGPTINKEPLV